MEEGTGGGGGGGGRGGRGGGGGTREEVKKVSSPPEYLRDFMLAHSPKGISGPKYTYSSSVIFSSMGYGACPAH